MESTRGAESMVLDSFRVVAAALGKGPDFVKSHISEIVEKRLTPTIQYIESNNLAETRFYGQLLDRMANLYMCSDNHLSDSHVRQAVINLLERSLALRMSAYGNRHPCILQTVWNLFGNYLASGLKEEAGRYLNHAHWLLHSEGLIAYPHLHETCSSMNKHIKNLTNGEKDLIPISTFSPDHYHSRDDALGAFTGNESFDIYKEYCVAAGSNIHIGETFSTVPFYRLYSLPPDEFEALYDFARNRSVQANNTSCKITFLPAYISLDGSISPFFEISVHDIENHRLLLPIMDGKREDLLSLPGTKRFEWFDYRFDNEFDLNGVF
jgi:hypothetical protein